MAVSYLGDAAESGQSAGSGVFGVLFNWLGALMSVALVCGLGAWGYQLAMRDVTGVPVVRALAGPMRIAPEDPGGSRAAHQGLSVNTVAADGGAAPSPDRLILAPPPLDLAAEDLPRPRLDNVAPVLSVTDEATPGAEGETVLALADGMAEGVTPLSGLIAPREAVVPLVPASVRGVSRSPLPRPRPGEDMTALSVAKAVALTAVSAPSIEVDPEGLPVGTRMVQFGAYDSPEDAREAWAALDQRFSDFLAEKQRVIQRAVSGGKTFYRLRAIGFADVNDARRFCSALLAERQACIPVVTR